MTENKRFTLDEWDIWDYADTMLVILQNGEFISNADVCELLNNLIEENEQLKQRNNRQAKQLDRLYRLVEEKDWRTLSDILDDFKRCEEQLQRESGTYGD